MNMKNYVAVVSLSVLYFLFCFLREQAPFFFLVGVPIIVGIAGYKLIDGDALVKRTFAGIIPVLALVWIFLFLDVRSFAGIAVLHGILIGLIVVQFWELVESCFHLIKKYKQKQRGDRPRI